MIHNQAYIDEKYLFHFFDSLRKSEEFSDERRLRQSILDFFQSKADLILESNIESTLDQFPIPSKQVISPIMTSFLTTNRKGTKILQNKKNEFRIFKNVNVYSKFKKPFSTFWLGNDYKYPIHNYRQKNPFYFLTNDDDLENWKLFSKARTFYVGPGGENLNQDTLNNWSKIARI